MSKEETQAEVQVQPQEQVTENETETVGKTCPNCGEAVQDGWFLCPNCKGDLLD